MRQPQPQTTDRNRYEGGTLPDGWPRGSSTTTTTGQGGHRLRRWRGPPTSPLFSFFWGGWAGEDGGLIGQGCQIPGRGERGGVGNAAKQEVYWCSRSPVFHAPSRGCGHSRKSLSEADPRDPVNVAIAHHSKVRRQGGGYIEHLAFLGARLTALRKRRCSPGPAVAREDGCRRKYRATAGPAERMP